MYRLTLTYILLALVAIAAHAQIIPFKNYTVREGLPSNYVSDIIQDPKGYMWMTTDNGLTRFDGYQFENYTIEDGLSDNYTNCLTVDSKGNIWVGTETGGVNKVNDWGVKVFDETNGLFTGAVDMIFTDNADNIWACSRQDGVTRIFNDSLITYNSENSLLNSNIFCHYLDNEGTVWFGNYDGVYFFENDSLQKIMHPELDTLIVWDIIKDQHNRLWIASQEHGVFCYDGDSVVIFNESNGLTTNTTLALLEDEKGRILVGTYYGGINVIENSVVSYEYIKETEDYWIWELTKDSRNRIWARTHENGVINVKTGIGYSISNNLINNYVNDIYEDNFNNLWITSKDGISILGKNCFEVFNKGFVDDNNNILSLNIDDKLMYSGTYSGLTIFNEKSTIKTYTNENGLPIDDPGVFKITRDPNSLNVYLATNGISILKDKIINAIEIPEMNEFEDEVFAFDLLIIDEHLYSATEIGFLNYSLNDQKYNFLTTHDGIIANSINSLSVDSNGNIWCGTVNGLSIFKSDTFYSFTNLQGLPNNYCNDISFDSKGIGWIATDYGVCASVLDKDFNLSTKNYSTKDGLTSNSIASVAADKQGNIWLGHDKGVDRLNIYNKSVKHYGYLDGFLPIECNMGAIEVDNQNNVWFGTIDGIVKYTPENDIENEIPPKAYIRSINLYNDTSSFQKYFTHIDSNTQLPVNLQLHHTKNNLYFSYVGLHYTIVEKNRYQYRLLGYEDEWSTPTVEIETAPYRKLPHGQYTFQVKAANCDGIWTEAPTEFSFEILPPFWKTWWFRILEILIAALLIYLISYLRVRKLRYDKKVLQQKVKERTIEIEKQKDQIEEQRDEISRQKKEITDSILYAKHIQSAILPKDETIAPLLKDYFILYKPRDIVSGDFYWIHGNEDKVIVLAADCTGHGVPGAFMSMLGVSILNEIATQKEEVEAGNILDSLREHVISTLSHSEKDQEARDGMDLAMCIIDFKNYSLQYAGAYNPLNIVRNNEAMVFKADKMPVGLHSGIVKNFTTNYISINKNDCLYMYSDGYADQFGGPEGKKFKSGTFRKLLLKIGNKPMEIQKEILETTITDWMDGYEQIDDILVMGIRIS